MDGLLKFRRRSSEPSLQDGTGSFLRWLAFRSVTWVLRRALVRREACVGADFSALVAALGCLVAGEEDVSLEVAGITSGLEESVILFLIFYLFHFFGSSGSRFKAGFLIVLLIFCLSWEGIFDVIFDY